MKMDITFMQTPSALLQEEIDEPVADFVSRLTGMSAPWVQIGGTFLPLETGIGFMPPYQRNGVTVGRCIEDYKYGDLEYVEWEFAAPSPLTDMWDKEVYGCAIRCSQKGGEYRYSVRHSTCTYSNPGEFVSEFVDRYDRDTHPLDALLAASTLGGQLR